VLDHQVMRLFSVAVVLALSALSVACGESPPARSPQSDSQGAAPTTTAAAVPEKTTSLRRSQVKHTIARGLGYFLQEVSVEDYPVMTGGKFHGFKIKIITGEWGVDLRPGDVVTRVNGMSIEHPEDADAALRSLEKAKALRVDFDREGKPRTLELPIVDD
jgi:type II secretory pathway component PulC